MTLLTYFSKPFWSSSMLFFSDGYQDIVQPLFFDFRLPSHSLCWWRSWKSQSKKQRRSCICNSPYFWYLRWLLVSSSTSLNCSCFSSLYVRLLTGSALIIGELVDQNFRVWWLWTVFWVRVELSFFRYSHPPGSCLLCCRSRYRRSLAPTREHAEVYFQRTGWWGCWTWWWWYLAVIFAILLINFQEIELDDNVVPSKPADDASDDKDDESDPIKDSASSSSSS